MAYRLRYELATWPVYAVKMFALLDTVEPAGGGTLLLKGSHRLIEHIDSPTGSRERGSEPDLLTSDPYLQALQAGGGDRSLLGKTVEVHGRQICPVEVTGEAGDVFLTHTRNGRPAACLGSDRASCHDGAVVRDSDGGGHSSFAVPAEIVAAWVLGSAQFTPVDAGQNSLHWLVKVGRMRRALRRYGADATVEDVHREMEVLGALRGQGLDVPVAVATATGERTIRAAGRLWSLFEWIDGERPERDDLVAARHVGRFLATAHETSPPPTVRTSRLCDFADVVRWGGFTLRSATEALREVDQDAADAVGTATAAVEAQLGAVRADPALVLVHGDLHPFNVLVDIGDRVVILDWAFSRRDQPAADLAVVYRLWPEGFQAVIAGYTELRALPPVQGIAIPALAAARGLDHLADRLTGWAAGRTVDRERELATELSDVSERLRALG